MGSNGPGRSCVPPQMASAADILDPLDENINFHPLLACKSDSKWINNRLVSFKFIKGENILLTALF